MDKLEKKVSINLKDEGLNDQEIKTFKAVAETMDNFCTYILEKDPRISLRNYTNALMIVTLNALGIDKEKLKAIFVKKDEEIRKFQEEANAKKD